jgi:hypothetical protein
MKKEVNVPPLKKIKGKVSLVAVVTDTNYAVTKDGRVFRELKATSVNERQYYNLVLDGVLRRVGRATLLKEVSNG